MNDAAPIPIFDVRAGGLVGHVIAQRSRALALRDDCLSWLPPSVGRLLPAMDAVTRRWLVRSQSPYAADVASIAQVLGFSGIWFLNGAYQWGCTSVVRNENGVPWLARTLDWPFPGLGRHLEIARMRGAAGEFLNVGWPGYVGTLTAAAPGRFAAAINQAPLWRRTRKPWLRPLDIALNAIGSWGVRFTPPDHLLREVFETCRDFAAAKQRLETVPVARPVIFVLAGCEPGECCVIERTEDGYRSRIQDTAAANNWLQGAPEWEARVNTAHIWTRTYEEAAERNAARRAALASWDGSFSDGDFAWVKPPVLNPLTRVAVEMCAANCTLHAMGYELQQNDELPRPATKVAIAAHPVLN